MVRTYSFLSLGEKCPYSELFWSAFFHIRTEYGETRSIFPYSVQMRENTDTFYAVRVTNVKMISTAEVLLEVSPL